MVNRRPQLRIVAPSALPDEAAAVVAALEQFLRDTAPPAATSGAAPNPWQRAALREAVGLEAHLAWGDGRAWGRSP